MRNWRKHDCSMLEAYKYDNTTTFKFIFVRETITCAGSTKYDETLTNQFIIKVRFWSFWFLRRISFTKKFKQTKEVQSVRFFEREKWEFHCFCVIFSTNFCDSNLKYLINRFLNFWKNRHEKNKRKSGNFSPFFFFIRDIIKITKNTKIYFSLRWTHTFHLSLTKLHNFLLVHSFVSNKTWFKVHSCEKCELLNRQFNFSATIVVNPFVSYVSPYFHWRLSNRKNQFVFIRLSLIFILILSNWKIRWNLTYVMWLKLGLNCWYVCFTYQYSRYSRGFSGIRIVE